MEEERSLKKFKRLPAAKRNCFDLLEENVSRQHDLLLQMHNALIKDCQLVQGNEQMIRDLGKFQDRVLEAVRDLIERCHWQRPPCWAGATLLEH